MKNQEIKFINKDYKYSILIGENILQILPKKINSLCPRTKNIAIMIDDNVPSKFKNKLRNLLKNYKLPILLFLNYLYLKDRQTSILSGFWKFVALAS